jgi:hypothetical protein
MSRYADADAMGYIEGKERGDPAIVYEAGSQSVKK